MIHNLRPRIWSSFLTTFFIAINAHVAWAQTDKSAYTIFNPTPKSQMRELSTDRPDKTESPYTVDAGHFQIEADIVTFSTDKSRDAGVTTESNSLGTMVSNLKVGLTNSMDLQVVVAPYQSAETKVTGAAKEESSGFGDTIVRLKYNVFGNDGGDVALGLMPFVKIPTASDDMGNDKYEGGLIIPIGLSLPRDWSMGLMAQVNRFKNDSDDKFHTEFISSITASHDIVGELAGYIEFFSQSSDEYGGDWLATADAGLTYKVTPDLQLDGGANVGLTRSADDFNPFLGISARF